MSTREKYMMPCSNPDAKDAPYVLVDREPSVRMAALLMTKITGLQKEAKEVEGLEGNDKILGQVSTGTNFTLFGLACGICKVGGNWDLYDYEWGVASPDWPRTVEDDSDFKKRVQVCRNFDQTSAGELLDKVQGFMKLSEDEVGK